MKKNLFKGDKMNKILFNTFKIVIATIISIIITNLLELDFYISAGIVTILTIQSTKHETIHTAIQRFIAFIIAIIISYLSFMCFGYNVYAFCIYLCIYIFICQYYKWYASMAVNSVLISHFLTFEIMDIYSITNELLLFVVGVGIGVLANLHLHKDTQYMNELKSQADEQIKYILYRMSERIINKADDYDGNCFDELNKIITIAKAVSIENEKNTLLQKDTYDKDYIKMREHQTQILYEMYKTIRKIHTTPLTAHIISDFLKKISEEYHEDNDCKELLDEFYRIDKEMENVPLPKARKEFEDRARLFTLLRLLEEFLEVKKRYLNQ